MDIRKSDTILVISGKDRGKSGKVIRAMPKDSRVVVEGVNVVMRHRRQQGRQKGQRVSLPMAIDRSNVMLLCPHCSKPTRLGVRASGDTKQRMCKRCSEVIL